MSISHNIMGLPNSKVLNRSGFALVNCFSSVVKSSVAIRGEAGSCVIHGVVVVLSGLGVRGLSLCK